jgi:hypothetical protein
MHPSAIALLAQAAEGMASSSGELLPRWESFYVITGSSAAALIGLQFVMVTLIAGRERPATPQQLGTFGTPTVLHFGAAGLLSAALSAPWPGLVGPSVALEVVGLVGVVYVAVTIARLRRVTGYAPVLEDWVWHVFVPLLAYLSLCFGPLFMRGHPATVLFVPAGAVLALLSTGIHNAWDAVAYIAMDMLEPARSTREDE